MAGKPTNQNTEHANLTLKLLKRKILSLLAFIPLKLGLKRMQILRGPLEFN